MARQVGRHVSIARAFPAAPCCSACAAATGAGRSAARASKGAETITRARCRALAGLGGEAHEPRWRAWAWTCCSPWWRLPRHVRPGVALAGCFTAASRLFCGNPGLLHLHTLLTYTKGSVQTSAVRSAATGASVQGGPSRGRALGRPGAAATSWQARGTGSPSLLLGQSTQHDHTHTVTDSVHFRSVPAHVLCQPHADGGDICGGSLTWVCRCSSLASGLPLKIMQGCEAGVRRTWAVPRPSLWINWT